MAGPDGETELPSGLETTLGEDALGDIGAEHTLTVQAQVGTGDADETYSFELPIEYAPPVLPGRDSPPRDLDDDGLYEDIDGDGEFTIFDVQALFGNLDADAVQQHPTLYNFNDGNPEEVSIFDVQGLFTELS